MATINVVIVSDSSGHREALKNILGKASGVFKVLDISGLEEIAERATDLQPEAIVFAPREKKVPFSLLNNIKITCPQTVLILVAGEDDEKVFLDAVRAGVDACVGTMVPGYLARILELVCRGGVVVFPRSIKTHMQKIVTVSEKILPGSTGKFTSREREIYELLAKKFSNKEIAERLFISESTVKTHIRNILRKIGAKNRAVLTENPGDQ